MGDRQMEPPWMPGVMSLAGSELAEPLVKKTISRFSCCVFGFGLVFFFPSGYSVALGVKLCTNGQVWASKAENPWCW